MKLGLLWLLVQKARKIYFYEQSPRTEEEYIETRDCIKKEISEIEQEYVISRNPKLRNKLKNLNARLKYYIISPLEYEVCKNTLEEYKKSYSHLIPEKFWNYDSLLQIYLQQYSKKMRKEI